VKPRSRDSQRFGEERSREDPPHLRAASPSAVRGVASSRDVQSILRAFVASTLPFFLGTRSLMLDLFR